MSHFCEECQEYECSGCFDFNGNEAEVDEHEQTCPEVEVGQ